MDEVVPSLAWQLSLDALERDAFAGELDRVGLAELVRRKSPSDSRLDGEVAELGADSLA
jgi:hypothetical protein